MLHRTCCYTLATFAEKDSRPTLSDLASRVRHLGERFHVQDTLVKELQKMDDQGSRYRNFEKHLGKGAWLVFGYHFPETKCAPQYLSLLVAKPLQLDQTDAQKWAAIRDVDHAHEEDKRP